MRISLATLALVACGSPAPPPAEPITNERPPDQAEPVGLTGTYVDVHEIQVVCSDPEGWCAEQVDDTMTVRDGNDGTLAIEVELIQTNAHTCSFSGTLSLQGPGRWRYHEDDPDLGSCVLTLTASAAELTLSADGCRGYCGARASLDATFTRRER